MYLHFQLTIREQFYREHQDSLNPGEREGRGGATSFPGLFPLRYLKGKGWGGEGGAEGVTPV